MLLSLLGKAGRLTESYGVLTSLSIWCSRLFKATAERKQNQNQITTKGTKKNENNTLRPCGKALIFLYSSRPFLRFGF